MFYICSAHKDIFYIFWPISVIGIPELHRLRPYTATTFRYKMRILILYIYIYICIGFSRKRFRRTGDLIEFRSLPLPTKRERISLLQLIDIMYCSKGLYRKCTTYEVIRTFSMLLLFGSIIVKFKHLVLFLDNLNIRQIRAKVERIRNVCSLLV